MVSLRPPTFRGAEGGCYGGYCRAEADEPVLAGALRLGSAFPDSFLQGAESVQASSKAGASLLGQKPGILLVCWALRVLCFPGRAFQFDSVPQCVISASVSRPPVHRAHQPRVSAFLSPL